MHPLAESRKILHGRHENETIHDENGMRHYYEEWGKLLDRNPSDPMQKFKPYPEFKEQVAQREAAAAAE
jgi:methanesulfonate monooxygenase large subunit